MNVEEVRDALKVYRPWVPEAVWRSAVEAVANAAPEEMRRELERITALLDQAIQRAYGGAR
jgi:hypothetical protein